MLPRLNVIFGFSACTALFYYQAGLPWTTVGVVVLVGLISISQVLAGRVRPVDEVADSLYFLGFVVTLLSLFVAFRTLSSDALQVERAEDAVKQLFGIIGSGLSTTIAGLMMRELISMAGTRAPFVEVGEVSPEDIKRVVDSLNAALALGDEAVEVSRTASESAAAYRNTFINFSTYLDEYSAHLMSFKNDVAMPLSVIKDELGISLQGISSELEKVRQSLGTVGSDFEETSQSLAELKSELSGVRKDIPSSLGDLGTAVKEATRSVKGLTSEYEVLAKALDQDLSDLGSIAKALPEIATASGEVGSGLRELANTAQSLENLEKQLSRFSDQVPGSFDGITTSSAKMERQLSELTSRYDNLIAALSRESDNLEKIAEGLPGEKIWKPLTYMADTMPSLNTHMRQSTKSLSQSSDRLDTASQELRNSQLMFSALVSALEDRASRATPMQPMAESGGHRRPKPPAAEVDPKLPIPGPTRASSVPEHGSVTPPIHDPDGKYTIPEDEEVIKPGSGGIGSILRSFFFGK